MKTIACVLSYKMPELTDQTVQDLVAAEWQFGENLFVFENQKTEDAEGASQLVTHFTGANLRMTGGWNYIADFFRGQAERIWFCTNDFRITYGVPTPRRLEGWLREDIGWWHPSLEPIPDYAYPWMFQKGYGGLRDVKMTDSICPAITQECMERLRKKNDGHVFDPAFYRGWGIDYDTCYRIRQMGRRVIIDDSVCVRHEASKTYTSGTAPETMEEFYERAHGEMSRVLKAKYGDDWHKRIMA